MRYSGIGGQAVLEGVMMRNKDSYAVAVRKPDKEIEVKVEKFESISNKYPFLKLPLLRGVVNFVESLYIGMKALSFASDIFEEEDDKEKSSSKDSAMTALIVTISILMAIGIFMILPYGISLLFQKFVSSSITLTIIEGLIRLLILITYMVGISFFPDIKRVYMYHGAEHKAINCVEEGLPLTVANVRKMTRKHLRCGTSFIINVIILSVILFMFIRVEHIALRLLFRVLLVPVIAAVAYEFLRIAGTSRHPLVLFLSIPGLWFQSLTTKEPNDSMIEVAIKSVEAVFDWESFISERKPKASKDEMRESVVKSKDNQIKEGLKNRKKKHKNVSQPRKDEKMIVETKPEIEQPVMVNPQEEEEDDEILNALDRFFNSQRNKDEKETRGKNK